MSVLEPRFASPTKKKRKQKPADEKWDRASLARDFMMRKIKGKRLRPEALVEDVGKAIDQAHAVWSPTSMMFKVLDAVTILSDLKTLDLRQPYHPQDDEVLALLDNLGLESLSFLKKCGHLLEEARRLDEHRKKLDSFLNAHPYLLKVRRQLVSEQQMIDGYVRQVEKRHGLKKKLEPKELETMVQLAAIHEGKDLADAEHTLQQMSVRWRTVRKKGRKGLIPKLEAAIQKAKTDQKKAEQKPSP